MHRLSLSAFLAAVAVLAACHRQPGADPNADADPVLNLPSIAKPQPPIDRAGLLAAVSQAASATAAGTEMPKSVRSLDGRQFEVRIRFGCGGPSADLEERWLGWSFDADEGRIRVRATPTVSIDDPLVERISDEGIEAVEGFWIMRPWLLAPACPASAAVRPSIADQQSQATEDDMQDEHRQTRPAKAPVDPADQPVWPRLPAAAPRIGIAQFFTREDPRSSRRDMRPYQADHRLGEGEALSTQGYNLVLSGRLRALPGRGVIHCIARSADTPPECIVSAEFLRVWIEQPETRKVIAEWGTG